jgi:hypothetical protein
MSAPVGPTGVVTTCSGDDGEHPAERRLHAGLAYGVMGAVIALAGGPTGTVERRAVSASLDIQLAPAHSLAIGAGAGLGGLVEMEGRRFDLRPGAHLSATWTFRLLDGRGKLPFLLGSLTVGGSFARSVEQVRGARAPETSTWLAFDARLGLTVGKTFFEVLSPYAAVRAVGGPVVWHYRGDLVAGSDPRHVQAALGLVTALPGGVDLYVEGAPLGERAVTIGGGKAF